MFHQNEDKMMKASSICSNGSSCWHMLASFVRVKNPGSRVKQLHWLHKLVLVVLLAGQAFSQTSAPTNTQTSVFYSVEVTVDVNDGNITEWLEKVFQSQLQSCLSSNAGETTATPTSPQTTSASTSYETTLMTATATTTLQSYNTTTDARTTVFTSNTTTLATTAFTSTTITTPVTTTTSKSTAITTPATTTSKSTATTTPATTVSKSTATTTPATTVSKSTATTTPATTISKSTATTTSTTTATKSTATTTTTPATTVSKSTATTTTTPAATATKSTAKTTSATTATKSTTKTTPAKTTASKSTTKTTSATTATKSTIKTTPAKTTASKSTTKTTPAKTTASKSTTKTTSATTKSIKTTTLPDSTAVKLTTDGGTKKPPPGLGRKERKARGIADSVKQNSVIRNGRSNGLYQDIEVECDTEPVMTNAKCSLRLKLKQNVPPCCILLTLCSASKASSDIQVVGKTANRIFPMGSGCDGNIQELNSCTYTGPTGASCEVSASAYTVSHSNSTNCGGDKENKTCSCSAFCSTPDAYYTFNISIQGSTIDSSDVSTMLSKLKIQPTCPPSADGACPLSTIASAYKDSNVDCGATTPNCRVILHFGREVPICNVSEAVMNVFESETKITYNGAVNRAAICGDFIAGDDPLKSTFILDYINRKPADFCPVNEEDLPTCPNGKNVVLQLEERCVQGVFTTLSPNVTVTQPNTTSSVNVTSSPLNTTAQAPNATTPATNLTVDGQANALLELTRDVSTLNSSQVSQLVSQLENLLSGPTVSLTLGNISVRIVSNLLGASPEVLSDSSNRIIGIVDTVGLKLVIDGEPQTLLSPAVALSVKPADGTNFQETFFTITDPNDVEVKGDTRPIRSVRADSSIPQGSIRLPPTLTQDLTTEQQQQVSRVQFNFYQESTVYQDISMGKRKLNSGILGASVANLSITQLQDDVVIHLRNTEPVPANFVATCVFWDFTLNDGSGGWNPRGCFVRNSTDNETICGCNHLTSFAILLDLAREPLTSRLQATILTFITYIGCGISAIFLSITLLTYLAFGKLRKDIPSKILIQLCLALLLLNLVFLVDAWLALYPHAVGLCISTAWFLHYFLLVSFTWMGLEAVHMYLALVKVFNTHISRYMLKFSLVGWGVPMIVVIIVIAVDKDNYGLVSYGRFSDGTSDDFCWLKNDIAFYVAVVAYFCVIFLFNLAMFVVVLVQLCRIKRQNPHNMQHRTTLQDMRSVAGITVLLGLTWGFAFFAWGPVNLAFMYLFAIFNSLQGFFIFLFYCAVKEVVRKQWRTYLCCGRMRLAENSEWSRTATQKTVKKSSMTRLTSLESSKSSKSNNSSSSSSFLVNDSSEQSNGIGSPFEDRTITADEDPSMDVVLNEINRQYRDRTS